jgi:hypothetical protein
MTTPYVWKSECGGSDWNYVATEKTTPVEGHDVVDFRVVDQKGRAVGMSRAITYTELTLCTEKPESPWPRIREVGKPTKFFTGRAHQTRNGKQYGGSFVVVFGETREACACELDKRIERARKAAAKKWGAK